jgi:hypothetical protein
VERGSKGGWELGREKPFSFAFDMAAFFLPFPIFPFPGKKKL